jgi:phage gp37-like protein
MKNYIKWTPVAIALAALFYSVWLGMNDNITEAQYTSHWPATILVFYLVIDKINKE